MDEKEVRFETIMDVGPIVISHTRNPALEEAVAFLKRVLKCEILCLIPISIFMGAYVIMTKYLGVEREKASEALRKTLSVASPIFYQDIPKQIVLESLKDACTYNISSWDAYIAELAKIHNISIVYTLDIKDFEKIPWLKPVLPISIDKFRAYQEWLIKQR